MISSKGLKVGQESMNFLILVDDLIEKIPQKLIVHTRTTN